MRPDTDAPEETLWEGRFIAAKRRGKWEYVSRTRGIHAAVILAVDEGHVLLVEQYRVPLGRNCLELPAGLVGDESEGEAVETAAIRELEEETGWRAAADDRARHVLQLARDGLGGFHLASRRGAGRRSATAAGSMARRSSSTACSWRKSPAFVAAQTRRRLRDRRQAAAVAGDGLRHLIVLRDLRDKREAAERRPSCHLPGQTDQLSA